MTTDDPRSTPSDFEQRAAAQAQHARDAASNIHKSRAPAEILTPDEAATIERSKGAAQ